MKCNLIVMDHIILLKLTACSVEQDAFGFKDKINILNILH
jgi:hypothetical protein